MKIDKFEIAVTYLVLVNAYIYLLNQTMLLAFESSLFWDAITRVSILMLTIRFGVRVWKMGGAE